MGKPIPIGAMVIPVINPINKGIKMAISQRGTPDDDKTVETAWMARDDSNTFLNPMTAVTVSKSSMFRLSLNPFKTDRQPI